MIVSSPLLTGMTVGADRRTVEAGDNDPSIPNTLVPVLPTQHQTLIANAGTEVQRFSSLTVSELTRTNQAALNTTVMTIGPGLWEIYLSMTNAYNWAHVIAAASGEVEVALVIGADIITLLADFAFIGSRAPVERRYRFLLLAQSSIRHDIALTGAGQTTDSMLTVNAVKIL